MANEKLFYYSITVPITRPHLVVTALGGRVIGDRQTESIAIIGFSGPGLRTRETAAPPFGLRRYVSERRYDGLSGTKPLTSGARYEAGRFLRHVMGFIWPNPTYELQSPL